MTLLCCVGLHFGLEAVGVVLEATMFAARCILIEMRLRRGRRRRRRWNRSRSESGAARVAELRRERKMGNGKGVSREWSDRGSD